MQRRSAVLGDARYWQRRQAAGQLVDCRPGGTPVHAITPQEITAILDLADQWGQIDRSHRKLAHRGSYERRVWVSPSTLLRVLLEHGRALPVRPPRARSEARPWPDWVDYEPLQVWGYDFTAFPAADTRALATSISSAASGSARCSAPKPPACRSRSCSPAPWRPKACSSRR